MKKFWITVLLLIPVLAYSQFEDYFTKGSLRVDFVLTGNDKNTTASLFELKKEPFFGGNLKKTIDEFDYGEFRFSVKDAESNQLIYTRGFCSLYEEWQTTEEAPLVQKSFYQTITFPFPKKDVFLTIERRSRDGQFYEIMYQKINPGDFSVNQSHLTNVETHKIVDNGSKDECVDIVFISEGYTAAQMDKFHTDVQRMYDYLITQAPFDKLKSKFNFWAVDAVSQDEGVTDPRKNIWKNTVLKSSFNTLNSDRYLETVHTFLVRDYAALVPYDQIYILANTEKYGGGGIYNHFSLTSIDNPRSLTVFIHEFGHAFVGLGDEYFGPDEIYNDYINQDIEPWQANLTTLKYFSSKWKDLLDKDTPVPTPSAEQYFNVTGVFEGGGYVSKGVYRPAFDCRMKTNEADGFCEVCQRAIEKMVLFLTTDQ